MSLVIHYLLRERKKSIAIIVTVILMVSTMSCIGNLIYGIRNSHSEYEKSMNGYFEYSFDVSEMVRNQVKKGMKGKCQIGTTQYITRIEDPVPVKVLACDSDFLKMNHMKLIEGKMPSNAQEIVVERWVLNNLKRDIKIGDFIKFGKYEYRVSGILQDSFLKSLKEMNVFTTFMLQGKGKCYISFYNKKNINKQMEEFADLYRINKDRINVNWEVLQSEEIMLDTNSQNSSVVSWLKGIPMNEYTIIILWSCLSTFMIYSIYYLSIYKREKDYGILKTLGCTKNRLFWITFLELFLLYFIGLVPGYFVGNTVTKIIYTDIISSFVSDDVPIADFQTNFEAVRMGLITMLLLFFVVSLFVTRMIFKKQSIDLIKKREKGLLKTRKIVSYHNPYLILNIANRYIIFRKKLLIFIVVSLSLGNIVFFTAEYTLKQIQNQKVLEIKSDSGLEADYRLCIENSDLSKGIRKDKKDFICKMEGIKQVYASRYTLGAVNLEDGKYKNKNYFEPENKDKRLKEMVGGICTKEKSGGYLLRTNIWGYDKAMIDSLKDYLIDGEINYADIKKNKKVIVRLSMSGSGKYDSVNIEPGDVIEIKVPKKEYYGKANILKFKERSLYDIRKLEVAATIKDIPTNNVYFIDDSGIDIIMQNDIFVEETGLADFNQIEIIKSSNSDRNELNSNLAKLVSGIDNCSYINYTTDVEKAKAHYKEQMFILGLISVGIFLIGILYMINCSRYLIHIQRKELAILRAIGLSNRGFYNMLRFEVCVYSLLTFVVTILGSIVCEKIAYFILKNVMFFYNVTFEVQWKMMIIVGLCSFVLCLLVVQVLVWSILKRKQIEVIKEE